MQDWDASFPGLQELRSRSSVGLAAELLPQAGADHWVCVPLNIVLPAAGTAAWCLWGVCNVMWGGDDWARAGRKHLAAVK